MGDKRANNRYYRTTIQRDIPATHLRGVKLRRRPAGSNLMETTCMLQLPQQLWCCVGDAVDSHSAADLKGNRSSIRLKVDLVIISTCTEHGTGGKTCRHCDECMTTEEKPGEFMKDLLKARSPKEMDRDYDKS